MAVFSQFISILVNIYLIGIFFKFCFFTKWQNKNIFFSALLAAVFSSPKMTLSSTTNLPRPTTDFPLSFDIATSLLRRHAWPITDASERRSAVLRRKDVFHRSRPRRPSAPSRTTTPSRAATRHPVAPAQDPMPSASLKDFVVTLRVRQSKIFLLTFLMSAGTPM